MTRIAKPLTAFLSGLLLAFATPLMAQTFPNKPIRIIVPFPPGGGNDVIARVVAQKLNERLGQQVVIDNRAGANGIVGLQALMQSPADGYTLAVAAAGPMAVNPTPWRSRATSALTGSGASVSPLPRPTRTSPTASPPRSR